VHCCTFLLEFCLSASKRITYMMIPARLFHDRAYFQRVFQNVELVRKVALKYVAWQQRYSKNLLSTNHLYN
jgi:hypothetical protein